MLQRLAKGFRTLFVSEKDWNPICLAPWVHSFVYTSGERRLCCVSANVPASESQDIAGYWNGGFMRKIRRTMLEGKFPPECSACVHKPAPLFAHFNQQYSHLKPQLRQATSLRGTLSLNPVSFDYRLSNHCNFKCRMCSSRYSSAAETEAAELWGSYSLPAWQREPKKSESKRFLREVAEKELKESIENKSVREIYWAGGEPLLLEAHWESMERILELGIESQVFVRYNTNLSTLTYKGRHLFRDLLRRFPRFSVGASLDATGEIGEYLRTGLRWNAWVKNLQECLPFVNQHGKDLLIAHTLTVPGLLDLPRLLSFCAKHQLPVSSQIVNDFHPSRAISPLSPLALPRAIRNRLLEETLAAVEHLRSNENSSVFALIENLISQPCWEITYPDYEKMLRAEARRMHEQEAHRNASHPGGTYIDFLSTKPYTREWIERYLI